MVLNGRRLDAVLNHSFFFFFYRFYSDLRALYDANAKVVLQRAAARYNLSVEGLKDVREGPNRRCKHDDITCVVFFLEGNEKNEGFGVPGAAMADGIGMKATEGVHLSQ